MMIGDPSIFPRIGRGGHCGAKHGEVFLATRDAIGWLKKTGGN